MGSYTYTGSVQKVTVGATGVYDITGYGAQGGSYGGQVGHSSQTGGKGAEIGGDFSLTKNEILEIYVGQAGAYGPDTPGGGGGGSFVLGSTDNGTTYHLLLAAGGGGGAYYSNGGAGNATGAKGTGSGGTSGTSGGNQYGGGGSGYKGNGTGNSDTSGGYNRNGSPAYGGGVGPGNTENGGFGGGGAGSADGGGQSGGGGGGGGRSFLATLADSTHTTKADGNNSGNGKVLITPSVACYVTGTFIRTARGDVAVEDLVVGDIVVTASGAHRPIRWLGHRTTDCRNHPRPTEMMPVRIAAHALGTNKPARDLYVSPAHAIGVTVIEEVLIPVSSLVNGTTIQQVEVDEVTYWHVELDSHDLLVAENLPAESYIEMGNRGFFREADVVALDALPDAPREVRTTADFCRPFHVEGPIVEAVRSHLRARRVALGWTLQHEPLADLHLIADGERIDPVVRDLTVRFGVPAGAGDVWLVSNTARPSEMSDSVDHRDLGVCLSGLAIDDGFSAARRIDLSDPLLDVGFHAPENGERRWTAGRSRMPAALWEDCPDGFFLLAEIGASALPRWVAPAGTAQPRAVHRAGQA